MLKRILAAAALLIVLAGTSAAETDSPAATGFSSSVTAKSVDIVDGNIDADTLRRIISGDVAGHVDELAKLRAKSITIPELTAAFTVTGPEPLSSTVIYRDIRLEEITDGVARSVSIGGIETTSGDGSRFNFGKMTTVNFDIPGILRFYQLLPAEPVGEPKTVYENLALEGGTLTFKDGHCTFGPMSVASVKARPLKTSFAEFWKAAEAANAKGGEPSFSDIAGFVGFMTDVPFAVELSPMRFGGFDCTGKDDDGKPVTIGLASVDVDAFAKGVLPRVALENLRIGIDNGSISFGGIVLKRIDLSKPLALLAAADPAALNENWFVAHQSELVPEFEGWTITDFKMDLPDKDDPDTRFRASVAAVDMTVKNYVNGIPTDSSMSISHAAFTLPAEPKDSSLKTLVDLGFKEVDLSFDLGAIWDEASRSIKLNRLALNGVDMGSIGASAVLGNVSEALFSDNDEERLAALLLATLDQINVVVEDGGLADRAFQLVAARQGQDVAALRKTLAEVAEATVVATLGGTPDASELGAAVAAFLGGAKSLAVSVRSRDGDSLSIADWRELSEDPQALGDRLVIDATAK